MVLPRIEKGALVVVGLVVRDAGERDEVEPGSFHAGLIEARARRVMNLGRWISKTVVRDWRSVVSSAG